MQNDFNWKIYSKLSIRVSSFVMIQIIKISIEKRNSMIARDHNALFGLRHIFGAFMNIFFVAHVMNFTVAHVIVLYTVLPNCILLVRQIISYFFPEKFPLIAPTLYFCRCLFYILEDRNFQCEDNIRNLFDTKSVKRVRNCWSSFRIFLNYY